MLLHSFNCCSCSAEILKLLPTTVSKRKSESVTFEKFKDISFNPLKTDKKTNNAMVLAIIPTDEMPVIMFIALFLLKLIAYRLAM